MSDITKCPDCGRLISLRFPLHDCVQMRTATTRVRSRSAGEKIVRRAKKAGGTATVLHKNRGETSWDVLYVLPWNVKARDIGITHDIVWTDDGRKRVEA